MALMMEPFCEEMEDPEGVEDPMSKSVKRVTVVLGRRMPAPMSEMTRD